jgi:hypothetical protein
MIPLDITLAVLRILLALLLYGFLAALLIVLLRDLRRVTGARTIPTPSGRLVVVEADDVDLAAGTMFQLQEVTSLGRTPANTIVIDDRFASAQHALLAWREERWWLEDQGSKNGTTLNGEPVTQPTIVSAGDLIGVGRVVLRLEVEK